MKTIITLAAVALLAGCANTGLTADQMAAMAGVSASMCINGPGWNGGTVAIHYVSFGGKSTGTAGGGGKAVCGASTAQFDNDGRAVPVAKPSP